MVPVHVTRILPHSWLSHQGYGLILKKKKKKVLKEVYFQWVYTGGTEYWVLEARFNSVIINSLNSDLTVGTAVCLSGFSKQAVLMWLMVPSEPPDADNVLKDVKRSVKVGLPTKQGADGQQQTVDLLRHCQVWMENTSWPILNLSLQAKRSCDLHHFGVR